MIKTIRCIHILLAALLLMPLAHAGESGALIKADELKAEPFRDAKTVAKLAVGDKVDILKKDGGWLKVKSAKRSGWVRMLSAPPRRVRLVWRVWHRGAPEPGGWSPRPEFAV